MHLFMLPARLCLSFCSFIESDLTHTIRPADCSPSLWWNVHNITHNTRQCIIVTRLQYCFFFVWTVHAGVHPGVTFKGVTIYSAVWKPWWVSSTSVGPQIEPNFAPSSVAMWHTHTHTEKHTLTNRTLISVCASEFIKPWIHYSFLSQK